jgi:hypothetical protein
MTTKTLTPQQIDEALDAAEAEAERLRAKQAAIAAAEHDARHAEELRIYRHAAGELSIAANRARSAAAERLDAIAQAEQLDVAALLQAFLELKATDAHCGAVAGHASQLDRVDPLPHTHNGAPRTRDPRTRQLYKDRTWSAYVDEVIQQRAEARLAADLAELQANTNTTISAAIETARAKAATLADGEQLAIDTPASITELHQAANASIDESTFDADKVRSAGPRAIRHAAENTELEQLVRAGN